MRQSSAQRSLAGAERLVAVRELIRVLRLEFVINDVIHKIKSVRAQQCIHGIGLRCRPFVMRS